MRKRLRIKHGIGKQGGLEGKVAHLLAEWCCPSHTVTSTVASFLRMRSGSCVWEMWITLPEKWSTMLLFLQAL